MTIHQLMNTCNAHPDVEVIIYNMASFEWDGKYEELDPGYFSRKVNYFLVDGLEQTPYRSYITHMKIYLEA